MRYYHGEGVPRNYKKAVRWFLLSAEQGIAEAQYNLGHMYVNGEGVPQEYVLAYLWWDICGFSGDKDCVKSRNLVEERMSKQQIEEAQEMASNWKPLSK